MTPPTNATRDEAARALGAIAGGQSIDWEHVLHRRSFLELDALARAEALVDDGTIRVLCGPFERLESPWLVPQDVTPQSDDGVVIAQGTIGGTAVVIA
jgi:malonate decarboxylase beta subunit